MLIVHISTNFNDVSNAGQVTACFEQNEEEEKKEQPKKKKSKKPKS